MEKINDIICIDGYGSDSNCYLIDDIIIDTGTGMNEEYLPLIIKENGLNLEDISLIVNTHCHFDHAGGNYLFPEAKVAVHEKDAQFIENENDPMTAGFMFGKSLERNDVDLKLNEGDKIANFEVLHTPGHTPGGISLWDGEILISGDTVFANGGFGRLDIGGNPEEMKDSFKKLIQLDVKYLLPGHGPWTEQGKRHIDLAMHMFSSF